jgi:hypothetical protein
MPRIRSFFFCFKKENVDGNNMFVFIFLVQGGKPFKITICSCFIFLFKEGNLSFQVSVNGIFMLKEGNRSCFII